MTDVTNRGFATRMVAAVVLTLPLGIGPLGTFIQGTSAASERESDVEPAAIATPTAITVPTPSEGGEGASRSATLADPWGAGDDEIARLIEGLASNSYATRTRCRDRLMRIGLAAFDQLREARNHPDNEVAIVARRLTSGLRVQWATPGDSPEARDLLSEYGSHSVAQRRKRIEAIAKLPRSDAFSPLLRLARFETEPALARTAALALIGHAAHTHAGQPNMASDQNMAADQNTAADQDSGSGKRTRQRDRDAFEAAQIGKSLPEKDRISSQWLFQYADDLRQGQFHVGAWAKVIAQNRQQLSPEGSASDSETEVATSELLELIRLTAERALANGNPTDALQIVVDHVDLIPARTQPLIESATWALDHSLYQGVVAMYQAHSDLYHKSPILLYSAAEAQTRVGHVADAAALADIALAINPLPLQPLGDDQGDDQGIAPDDGGPVDPNKPLPLHPQIIENHAEAHVEIAAELADRGLFHWAEQEYQLVIDRLPVDTAGSAFARLQLAMMFGELLRHAAVVETLSPLAQRIDQDDEFRDRLILRRFPYMIVRSNMDFHRGLLLIDQGDREAAKVVLRAAFELNQVNIDILIAMFRLDGDTTWKEEVAQTLDEQIRLAASEVKDARNSNQRAGAFRVSDSELAKRLNAYAWLVSNTAGDTQRALRDSQESLRLTPNEPALMDTCARCHFAVGDIEAAIHMQADACQRMPHSPPLQRQLQEFRDALADQ